MYTTGTQTTFESFVPPAPLIAGLVFKAFLKLNCVFMFVSQNL